MKILLVSSKISRSLVNIIKNIPETDRNSYMIALYNPLQNLNVFKILKNNRFSRILSKVFRIFKLNNCKVTKKFKLRKIIFNDINSQEFKKIIKDNEIDVMVTYDCVHILKEDVICLPSKMSFNIHNSFLPSYRGTDPIYWVLKNKENFTGVSAHKLEKRIDTGDILFQKKVRIEDTDNYDKLLEKLFLTGSEIFFKVIKMIHENEVKYIKQDESYASYYSNSKKIYGKF